MAGQAIGPQLHALKTGCGRGLWETPGRILDHIRRQNAEKLESMSRLSCWMKGRRDARHGGLPTISMPFWNKTPAVKTKRPCFFGNHAASHQVDSRTGISSNPTEITI
jgi:hypothetical protein